jgi:hypothetical protein
MKTLQYLAFVLIGVGILGVIGYCARVFFADPLVPLGLMVLAGIAAVGQGKAHRKGFHRWTAQHGWW